MADEYRMECGSKLQQAVRAARRPSQRAMANGCFCASDMLAIPAMRAVVENQGRIPEDIAIVGMDNIDVAQYTTPPLSSVSVPKYEIGRVAAKSIVDYLDGHFKVATKILLPCSLIVRESSSFTRTYI